MKEQRFRDRAQAGHLLAARLAAYANRPDIRVLALPRGGVPVGYQVARALHVPLDVMIVRKLGVPGQEELALGAIASGGVCALNDDVIRVLGIPEELVHEEATREQHEVERREHLYRQGRLAPEMHRRTVILVDDGMATGATMRAALVAVKQQQPARIIIAVPVAASATCEKLAAEADEVVCLLRPGAFLAVGYWYQQFSQTTDEEVANLLARAARELALTPPQRRETPGAESQQQCTGAAPPVRHRSRRISQPSHLSRNSQRQRQYSPQEVGWDDACERETPLPGEGAKEHGAKKGGGHVPTDPCPA